MFLAIYWFNTFRWISRAKLDISTLFVYVSAFSEAFLRTSCMWSSMVAVALIPYALYEISLSKSKLKGLTTIGAGQIGLHGSLSASSAITVMLFLLLVFLFRCGRSTRWRDILHLVIDKEHNDILRQGLVWTRSSRWKLLLLLSPIHHHFCTHSIHMYNSCLYHTLGKYHVKIFMVKISC